MNYAACFSVLSDAAPGLSTLELAVSAAFSTSWEVREPWPGAYRTRGIPGKQQRSRPARRAGSRARQRTDTDATYELLRTSIRQLRLTTSVVITAAGALRHQNADHDRDFANVLQRCASDRLDIEIEKMEALITRLDKPRR